ncbi:MAG: hypothetical protein K6E88_01790 [Lachnospiraceae bacterium]|nr:hypothetical protein [Lachnospiraceae bacterium]
MSKFLYYCPNCNKLYMAGEAGKTVKCTGCSEIALDMGISSDEYNALNAAQKQELKNRIILKYTADESYEDPMDEDAWYEGLSDQDTAHDNESYENAEHENVSYEDTAHENVTYAGAEGNVSGESIAEKEIAGDDPGNEAMGSDDEAVKKDADKTAAKTDADTTVVLRRRRGIAGNSRAGRILIALSKIGLLLSLIGSAAIGFLVANEMYASVGIAYGLVAFLVCTLLCLIIMGIGEISILLASVNAKLDEK